MRYIKCFKNKEDFIKYPKHKMFKYLISKLHTNISLNIKRFSIFKINGEVIYIDDKSFRNILEKTKKYYILHEEYESIKYIDNIEKMLPITNNIIINN